MQKVTLYGRGYAIFKLYPTATEKELAYYVAGNVIEPIGRDYLYSTNTILYNEYLLTLFFCRYIMKTKYAQDCKAERAVSKELNLGRSIWKELTVSASAEEKQYDKETIRDRKEQPVR